MVPLAKELGVTRVSFYWHFSSRDELLELRPGALGAGALRRDPLLARGDARPAHRLAALRRAATSNPPSIFIQLIRASDYPIIFAFL